MLKSILVTCFCLFLAWLILWTLSCTQYVPRDLWILSELQMLQPSRLYALCQTLSDGHSFTTQKRPHSLLENLLYNELTVTARQLIPWSRVIFENLQSLNNHEITYVLWNPVMAVSAWAHQWSLIDEPNISSLWDSFLISSHSSESYPSLNFSEQDSGHYLWQVL
jgi:hypothetical protein